MFVSQMEFSKFFLPPTEQLLIEPEIWAQSCPWGSYAVHRNWIIFINFIILISDENNDNLDSAEISRAKTQLLEKDIGKHTSSFLVRHFLL